MSSFWKWSIKTTSSFEKWSLPSAPPPAEKITNNSCITRCRCNHKIDTPLQHSYVVEGVLILFSHPVRLKLVTIQGRRRLLKFGPSVYVVKCRFSMNSLSVPFGRRSLWTPPNISLEHKMLFWLYMNCCWFSSKIKKIFVPKLCLTSVRVGPFNILLLCAQINTGTFLYVGRSI